MLGNLRIRYLMMEVLVFYELMEMTRCNETPVR